MKVNTLTIPKSIQKLVNSLEEAINIAPLSPKKAHELVLAANIESEDLNEYADFDHPIEDNYGRKMVCDFGRFEIMVMSWNPGHYSSIHNHGYTQWGVVQAFGPAHNINFCVKNDRLQISRKQILQPGEAIKVNNALIHQMGNPTSESFLSLHVYGANTRPSHITADAKNYDLEYQRISHTTGGAFFNLPASDIYDIEAGVKPTNETFLHYAGVLMDYYERQPLSGRILEQKEQLLEQMEGVLLK